MKMLNKLSGDFLGFVALFSQYLDVESLFYWKLNVQNTVIVSFGPQSPEAEANLWNLMIYFDGSGAWSILFHSPFRGWEIAVCDT
jgi:hypothetical protein